MPAKKHKSTRKSCRHCSGSHTTSQHSSHGVGSFLRIHKAKKKAKKKKRR